MHILTRSGAVAPSPFAAPVRSVLTAAARAALGSEVNGFLEAAKTRAMPDERQTRAASAGVQASTYNAENHTVELILSTGARVKRWGYYEELLIDAAAIDLSRVEANAVKILDSHDACEIESILGALISARIENGQLIGLMKFAQTAQGIAAEGMVARGELTSISVGYSVTAWRAVEILTDPTSGVEITVWSAVQWTLMEASFLSVPADPGAGVRSAGSFIPSITSAGSGGTNEADEMITRSGAGSPANPNTNGTVERPANGDTRLAPVQQPAPVAPATDLARFSPTETLEFTSLGRSLGVESRATELVNANTSGTMDPATCRSLLLEAAAQRNANSTNNIGNSRIEVGTDARDKFQRGAVAAFLHRAGVVDVIAAAARKRGITEDLDPGELRGIQNVELARICLENQGVNTRGIYDRNRIVGMALETRNGVQGSGDFPVLLESAMHKVLAASYTIAPDTWSRFCGIGTLTDFRPHPRYARGSFSALDSKTENGEFKQKAIPDGAKESITGATKGNIVGLTRQALVNDDMGVFTGILMDLGRAAKMTIEMDVYALLAQNSGAGPAMNDTNALFHTAHANIAATNAAPSVAAFDSIRVLMGSQKDYSGNDYLNVDPYVWLGPLSLGGSVRGIVGAEYDPDTANKLQKPNIVKGIFKDIVDTPRLSGTRWYAFADPRINPAIEVAFLDGQQDPYLEQQYGWRYDGSEFKVRLDYGVGAVSYKAAATNAGA
jgi:phage head maturation protease